MLKTLAEMAATIAAVPLYIHYLPGIACADMEAALQTGFALALLYLLLRPLARFLTGWLSCLSLGLSNILVDAGLVMLCAELMKESFWVAGFRYALLLALVINVARMLLGGLFEKKK